MLSLTPASSDFTAEIAAAAKMGGCGESPEHRRLNGEARKIYSRQIYGSSMLFGSAGLLDFGLLTRFVCVPIFHEIAHVHQSSLQGVRNSSECVRSGGWKSR